MLYRVTTYYSLKGFTKLIDLGDVANGEWIVYDNKIPKYHIHSFNKGSDSDVIIHSLLKNKKETIKSIVYKINAKQGTKLSFGNKPIVEIVKKSELINLELIPLSEHWVKNID
ncbi:MAG: uncharacterized protein JWR38_5852 [Mucilaginibacter sp.]|nr:uncharacterized protein [Mucilaginibacter sp.]